MEMSPNPEKALKHGDCLKDLVPDSGHLIHMATHIDVLCGDYQNVLYRNFKAIEADELYKSYAGTENFMLFTEYIIFILLFMVQCF